MRTLAALTTAATTLVGGAMSATAQPNLLLDHRRRLQVDDATAAACEPTLQAYYDCAGVTEDPAEDTSSLYYYDTEDISVFCDAVTALEDSESCSTIGDVDFACQAEYETAITCYSEAACGSPFECVASQPPVAVEKLVANIAFYNVNPNSDVVCFSYATNNRGATAETLVEVAYEQTVHADIYLSLDVSEPYQVFVRVSETCELGSWVVESMVDVYLSASNLISWSLPADVTSSGYLQTIRRNGPEPTIYFLNEVTEQNCEFKNLVAPYSYSVGFHQAATVDLSCDDLERAEFAVSCKRTSGANFSETLLLNPRDICADTSLHLVAYSAPGGDDVNFDIFQGTDASDACERRCKSGGGSKKSKSGLSSGVIAAIAVCAAVLVLLAIVVAYKCRQSQSTGPSDSKEARVTLDTEENMVHTQDRDSML